MCAAVAAAVVTGRWAGHAYWTSRLHVEASLKDIDVVPAPPWWERAERAIESADLRGSAQDGDAVWLGPSAAAMRALPVPIEVGDALPTDVDRRGVQKDCNAVWLLRHILPPARDEAVFLARVHEAKTLAFRGTREHRVELGFDIHRESVDVGPCGVDFAVHGKEVFRVRVECQADRESESILAVALADAFAPVPNAFPTSHGDCFWRADYEQPDGSARVREALAAALGATPALGELSPALSAAYERLMSPLESLVVWKGAEGWGYNEVATLLADLLRGVMRGPNPEGRALAALALNDAHALDASDRLAIASLAAGSPKVAFGVENHDDANGYMLASQLFVTLRWPRLKVARR